MSDDDFTSPDHTRHPDRDKRAPRFSWTPAYEGTFFRSLCESVSLGLRENHSFKGEAWDRAAAALRDQHGAYPAKSHLVNKSDNARKKFRLWRGLREHPEFLYNPATRTVTASDEAWKAHIEKEPLSRALRGRPFEHEHFMEILYPDVVGSGGAPKRIMKPKRKGPDVLPGCEDTEMPGTAILNLALDQTTYTLPGAPASSTNTTNTTNGQGQQQGGARHVGRPTSTTLPPRTSIGNASALTPPDETATHTRKRFAAPTGGTPGVANDHRLSNSMQQNKRRRISQNYTGATSTPADHTNIQSPSHNPATLSTSGGVLTRGVLEDAIIGIAESLSRARATPPPPRWPEQALEIFFRDFADEDMDLQVKIAEKALADEVKAMVFCKMTPALRSHWVKRLREVHNRVL